MTSFTIEKPRLAYLVAIVLVFAVFGFQNLGTRLLSKEQAAAAVEINLSGRQRMLSQRIALTIERLEKAHSTGTAAKIEKLNARLLACARLMDISHVALAARTVEQMAPALQMGRSCLSTDASPEPDLVAAEVQPSRAPLLSAYTAHAREVATGVRQIDDIDRDLLRYTSIEKLLAELDAATFSAQQTAVANIRYLLIVSWIVLIGLVVGAGLLVFRPLVRSVEQNLAQLRSTNRELVESEQRLKDFAATGANHFWETDADHKLSWIAAAGATRLVPNKALYMCKTRKEMAAYAGEIDASRWAAHEAVLNAHEPFENFEYSIQHEGDETRWWRVHGRPVFDQDGTFTGYRGTSLEVTQEKNAELQSRHTERMNALGQLTAGVAHDFNNLLAVVRGNAELLELETEAAMRRNCVEEITSAVEKGAALTGRLLAFGRVQDLRAEVVDLRALFDGISVLLDRIIGVGFTVELKPPPEGLCVYVDRHQLENAFINLALNARDACSEGGKLVVTAQKFENAPLTTASGRALDVSNLVCICFADTGCGMEEAELSRAFDPFFSTKPVGQGSGLGLSMVYGFARQSKGFVDITSQKGQGTSVKLCLPVAPRPPSQSQEPGTDLLSERPGKRVLLLEDDPAMRRVARRLLENLDFAVVETSDGASAIKAVRQDGPYDLMLADVLLPGGMNGIEAVTRVRAIQPDLPVLFMSGYAGDQKNNGPASALPEPLIRKPFSFADLEQHLQLLQNAPAPRAR